MNHPRLISHEALMAVDAIESNPSLVGLTHAKILRDELKKKCDILGASVDPEIVQAMSRVVDATGKLLGWTTIAPAEDVDRSRRELREAYDAYIALVRR